MVWGTPRGFFPGPRARKKTQNLEKHKKTRQKNRENTKKQEKIRGSPPKQLGKTLKKQIKTLHKPTKQNEKQNKNLGGRSAPDPPDFFTEEISQNFFQ